MAKKFKFIWAQDEDTGIEGWRLASQPHFTPVQGMGLAHDVLEHFRHADEFASECMAFGVIVWGRAIGGYWDGTFSNKRRPMSPEEVGAMLGEELARISLDNRYDVPTRRAVKPVMEEAEEFIAPMHAAYIAELLQDSDNPDEDRPHHERAATMALHWVRAGYLKAERAYGELGHFNFCNLFANVEYAVNEIRGGEFGQGLMVTIEIRKDGHHTHEVKGGYMDDNGRIHYDERY